MTMRHDRQAKMVVAYSVGYLFPRLVYRGVAYMAAMPAKKSRAKALPPVAEAEYTPYA